jgi:putative iron-dependent peroxidase
MTVRFQPAILAPVPLLGRHLVFDLHLGTDPRGALQRLRDLPHAERTVVGLGAPLTLGLGAAVAGLRAFPGLSGRGCAFPSTQGALWVFLAGADATELHDRGLALRALLGDGFSPSEEVACFRYREGRDLTGFEDGTENPTGERAVEAAIVAGGGPGLDGSSFVAVQRYVHDLERFARLPAPGRDAVIGRRMSDNEEMADAPETAHVKRTAQESFDPAAFMVRRSMPWGGVREQGLYFVAYGESLDRFERVLTRMAGLEDGQVDALLGFTRAVGGGYYWCPPAGDRGLELSVIGL